MLRKTLNSEILKNSSGRVRVAKKKFGSGRVAGTRQALIRTEGTLDPEKKLFKYSTDLCDKMMGGGKTMFFLYD